MLRRQEYRVPMPVTRIVVLTGACDARDLRVHSRRVKAATNAASKSRTLQDSFDGLIEPNAPAFYTPRDVTGILRLGGPSWYRQTAESVAYRQTHPKAP